MEKKKYEDSKQMLLEGKQLIFETSEDIEVNPTFQDMGLREELLKGIYCYGFEKPSAVQQRAIRPIIKGRDVIVQSQNGTGKTAVFCLGALQTLDLGLRQPQVLVLSPTRELAEQTQKVALALGDFMTLKVLILYRFCNVLKRFIAVLEEKVLEMTRKLFSMGYIWFRELLEECMI